MTEGIEQAKTSRELDRLVFFNDAVFAIAITLLALEIRIPTAPGSLDAPSAENLVFQGLLSLLPTLWSFIISFFAIGTFWVGNHYMHRFIVKYNRPFLWINLLFLMFIVLIPAASALLGTNPLNRTATIVYGLTLSATSFAAAFVWWYAAHNHRLVDPHLDDRFIRIVTRRDLIAPFVFLLSLPLALISPLLSQVTWYALLLYTIFLGHRGEPDP